MKATDHDYDVIVLGGGSAGYAAARTAAGLGLKTAVVEGGEQVGGLCILRGCMPTKALLYSAEVLHLARKSKLWGMRPQEIGFDFTQVMARKNALIREFAGYREQQLQSGPFAFIRSKARFLDPYTIALLDGKTLKARFFLIATGSVVSPPPLPALNDIGCLTSDAALSLDRLPKSLIMLGGGAVAVEFAQFFARFDVPVTLIQRSAQIVRDFDADAAKELEKVFRREGIELFTETRLTGAWRNGGKKGISFLHNGTELKREAEEIFHGLGRSPNTASLGLEAIGVQCDHGRIITDAAMRSSLPHIFAAGDCTGPHEIVHLAIQQGEVAAHNMARLEAPRSMDYRLLTQVIFTEPQLASAGLGEKEARARGIPYLAASYPFADHGKSLIMDAMDGFVKLLADPGSGEILGGCVAGPIGGELIHEITAALAKRMTVSELAAMPHYHPTLAEIWTYPAEELASKIQS